MIQVFHNPRCSKSRIAIDYLTERGIAFEPLLYMNGSLTREDLVAVLKKLNLSAFDIVRKTEADYKSLVKDQSLSESELIELMLKHPNLIERPIVVNQNKAVVARPTELIDSVL